MEGEEILRQWMPLLPVWAIFVLGRKAGFFPKFPNLAIDLTVQFLQILALLGLLNLYAETWRLSFIPGALF